MPLMEAFEEAAKPENSRYIFVPKPGKFGAVLSAVSVMGDGTTRFEIKGKSKAELAKKAALLEKALGGKPARRDVTKEDGTVIRTLTAITELKNLEGIIPKGDLEAATVEAIRRGLITPLKSKAKTPKSAGLRISVEVLSDTLPA